MTDKPKTLADADVQKVIDLFQLLARFGEIKRATRLPNGEQESDAHHCFSLALLAFEVAKKYAPELSSEKLLLYALVHDLPELVTGDISTLTTTREELAQKTLNDAAQFGEALELLADYPHIAKALTDYEEKVDEEALFIYWLDKMIVIPTHFYDNGQNLRQLGIKNRQDIRDWYERLHEKLALQQRDPHEVASKLLERTYQRMHDELLED